MCRNVLMSINKKENKVFYYNGTRHHNNNTIYTIYMMARFDRNSSRIDH